ncbi:MAG: TonB-dependent receptor [Gammaproteobacteria bacterium]|nr:MAG: TonB-dependent receptor [Gammaproteobacteria bacterium]
MISKRRIAHALKRVSLLSLAAVSAAVLGVAQSPAQEATRTDATLQTVVVTGSRIATPELESPVPVTILSEQMIQNNGAPNVSDILRELPSVGTSALSTTNSNFLVADSGVNTINLRNLGDQRTLVLVNGRRFTPGVAGNSEVDFNMIPTDFIDHVEIITGGASAVYGSDAVAGVVNVIYQDKFEGIRTRFQGGATDHGDSARYVGALTFGQPFAAGRGHLMLNLSYDKDEGLRSSQRAFSSVDQAVNLTGTGTLTKPAYSSFAPQGRFEYADICTNATNANAAACAGSPAGIDNVFTFHPDNTLKNGFSSRLDGFNRDAYRRISTPLNRTLLASVLNFDLTEHHRFYNEITYGITRAQSEIEPFALASNIFAGSVYGGGADPATGEPIGVPITNAYLQTMPELAPVVATINAYNAANPTDPVRYLQFRKRLLDIADRGNDAKRQTLRTALGLKGDVPIDGWTYDTSFVYGRTTDDQVSAGQVNLNNFRFALDSVVEPTTGKIVCADPVAVALGCVPINVFGNNSITPAAADWVNAPVTRNVTIQEQVITGYVQGPALHLPAGPLSLVVGVEGRKDTSEEIWDSLTNKGLNGFNALPNIRGSFNVREAFAETVVPVLKDVPFAKTVQLDGAFRQANYSTIGSVHSWKSGLEWAPVEDVRFRGVYSEAIRAPNIGELFGGISQTFPNISDPCNGVTATSTGPFAAACRAIPGVANAITQNGVFQYQQVDLQSVTGFNGSNPNLNSEAAKTTTLGFVLRPQFLPNFAATIDWYDIKVDAAVSTITRGDSINQCLLTGNPVFCSNVIRNAASGKITAVNAQLINVGGIRTAGIETSIRYLWDLTGTRIGGKLNLTLSENHLQQLEQINFPGAPPTDNRKELFDGSAQTRLGAGFEDRGILTADYTRGPLEFSWTANYLSSIQDTLAQNGIISDLYNTVPAYIYHDVQVRFRFGGKESIEAYLGAKNVFDKQPPVLPQGMASTITGTETAADTYDVFGRFLYGGFTAKF